MPFRRLRAGLVLSALLAGPAVQAGPAEDCRDSGRLTDAERLPLCTAAIEAATDDRDRADLLLWRGAILGRRGDSDLAMADFAAAEALAPGWADPLVDRAWAIYDGGDLDGALEELARAREVEPDSVYALHESMNLLPDAGRWQDCLALAPDAVRLAPEDPYTWAFRGRCLHDGGQFLAAVGDYRKAMALGLDEGFLRSNLAGALLDLGSPGKARPEAEAAVALDPSNPMAQRNLVASLLQTGDPEGAIAAFRAAQAALGETPRALANEAAWGLYLAGRHVEGLEIAETWVEGVGAGLTAEDADIVDSYAHLLAAAGQPDRAVQAFLKAVELGGPGRRDLYAGRLAELGFGPGPLEESLRACAATGAACRLAD